MDGSVLSWIPTERGGFGHSFFEPLQLGFARGESRFEDVATP
jgi:hypothetical protein